eukprot:XP_001708769.1 Hypothetical protein GL50803_103829 [Giardia lamblia ATCC 50803]
MYKVGQIAGLYHHKGELHRGNKDPAAEITIPLNGIFLYCVFPTLFPGGIVKDCALFPFSTLCAAPREK